MNSTVNTSYPEYPVFKGLQRPLEFMGLRGRYIYWAAVTAGCAILSFIVVYSLLGFVVGLVVLTVIAAVGIALIILKQMKGLHTKKEFQGILIYRRDSEI
jgi:type IV secretory pathway VirB3-like protein